MDFLLPRALLDRDRILNGIFLLLLVQSTTNIYLSDILILLFDYIIATVVDQ